MKEDKIKIIVFLSLVLIYWIYSSYLILMNKVPNKVTRIILIIINLIILYLFILGVMIEVSWTESFEHY